MSKWHSLNIIDLEHLTDESVKVVFGVPDTIKQSFVFKPGQYINLKKKINGEEVIRSYSICSAPNEALAVGIREVQGGLFSTYANNDLKIGDELDVSLPEGNFTLPEDIRRKRFSCFYRGFWNYASFVHD